MKMYMSVCVCGGVKLLFGVVEYLADMRKRVSINIDYIFVTVYIYT